MILKTSEILIDKETQDAIVKNWNYRELKSVEIDILDNVNRLNLTLRIPVKFKGIESHLLIPGKIEMKGIKNRVALSIHCNFMKPMIISFILGILSSVLFLAIYFSLVYFIGMTILITGVIFGIFYFSVLRRSYEYISKLKDDYL